MTDSESLPLPQRLGLAYAPPSGRAQWGVVLAFDHRLAHTIAQAREPMLKQIRLAWWRDMVRGGPASDPLLARMHHFFPGESDRLVAAIDAWEELITTPILLPATLDRYARGRAEAFAPLFADATGTARTDAANYAIKWSLGDLVAHAGDPSERRLVAAQASQLPALAPLPRTLRPLAILGKLGARALRKGEGGLLDDRGGAIVAIRVGIFGR